MCTLRLLRSLAGHAHLQLADDLVGRLCRLVADDCRLWAPESQPRTAAGGAAGRCGFPHGTETGGGHGEAPYPGHKLAFIAAPVLVESVDAAGKTDANTNFAIRRTIVSEKDMGNAIHTSRQIRHPSLQPLCLDDPVRLWSARGQQHEVDRE